MSDVAEQCDVVVIGGGPAGSTAAALLAERGRDVVLLEKDVHPRFLIGESLLPANLPILDRLGVHAEVAAMGVFKPGAEFVSDDTGRSIEFPFALSLNKGYTHSYQVRRSEFDAALLDNARLRGARVFERTRATDVVLGAGGARARVATRGEDGLTREFTPRFVLDGSGRDTFLAGRLRLKQADKRNNTAALFAHFRGVECRPGTDGYTSVHFADDGWFWMIPLKDGIMSVGFVGNQKAFKDRRGSKEDLLLDRLRRSPTVSARMAGAEQISEVIAAGNYSYRAHTAQGDGWFLIGDAFAFMDPVFSSGVLLAMVSGEMGAEIASAWLDDPTLGRRLAQRAERRLRAAMDRMSWLIYRIHTPILRDMFMAPSNILWMRDGLLSTLSGDIRPGLRSRVAMLAFKASFRVLSLSRARRSQALLRRTATRYANENRFTRRYVAAKLRRDPVHADVLALAARETFGAVADIGCGYGQLGAALLEAGLARSVLGIDRNMPHLDVARRAGLSVRVQDLTRDQTIPTADTVLLIDVLYQLDTQAQDALIGEAARTAGTRVMIRTLDPGRGTRSMFSLAWERLCRPVWPHSGTYVNARPLDAIADRLTSAGFAVEIAPCWRGTPFANVLLIARRVGLQKPA